MGSEYLTLDQARHLLPGPPSLRLVRDWRRRGVAGVRLQATRLGRRYVTTAAWVGEFVRAKAEAEAGPSKADRVAEAEAEAEWELAVLRSMGV